MEVEKILLLEPEFTKKGDTFRQIHNNGIAFIYERTMGGTKCYEVFRRTLKSTRGTLYGKHASGEYSHYEVYPGNEQFGRWAWCCKTLDRALERFKSIKRAKKK